MKYFYLICLISFLNFSCIPRSQYDDLLKQNKFLEEKILLEKSNQKEKSDLEFKIHNILFDLDICNAKIRSLDQKLIECLNLKECK